MLVIRFLRTGKKNQPYFKIVVTDKRKPPRAGRFVEELGSFNPKSKEKVVKAERVTYWLSVGAQPSPRVHNILVSKGILKEKKIPVHAKKKEGKSPPAGGEPKPEPKEEVKKPEAESPPAGGEPAKPEEEKKA